MNMFISNHLTVKTDGSHTLRILHRWRPTIAHLLRVRAVRYPSRSLLTWIVANTWGRPLYQFLHSLNLTAPVSCVVELSAIMLRLTIVDGRRCINESGS
jgi:hypothetical protein